MARKKKTTVKSTTKTPRASRKQCLTEGCRRMQKIGTLCERCAELDPVTVVTRITPLEAAQWSALDLEMRNALQGVEILKRGDALAHQAHQQAMLKSRRDQAELIQQANAVKVRYDAMTVSFAQRFDFDPKKISIDADTCVVRENETS